MSDLIGIFVGIAAFLIETTILVVQLAARPVQFIFSAGYRKEICAGWHGKPGRQILEVFGGTLWLGLLAGVVVFWGAVFSRGTARPEPAKPTVRHQLAELRARVSERVKLRKEREAREPK